MTTLTVFKIIALLIITCLASYLAFAFFSVSFDISTWGEQARFFCMLIGISAGAFLSCMGYLDGPTK